MAVGIDVQLAMPKYIYMFHKHCVSLYCAELSSGPKIVDSDQNDKFVNLARWLSFISYLFQDNFLETVDPETLFGL